MFRRNREEKSGDETTSTDKGENSEAGNAPDSASESVSTGEKTMSTNKPGQKVQQGFVPELPRRTVDISGPNAVRAGMNRSSPDAKKLTVGPEISLSGEITACDTLVVEGSVEATLQNSRVLEVSETGSFKGTVTIEEARIAGRFEGNLLVRGKLSVAAHGKISGEVSYGALEVEAGGEISGTMKLVSAGESGSGQG